MSMGKKSNDATKNKGMALSDDALGMCAGGDSVPNSPKIKSNGLHAADGQKCGVCGRPYWNGQQICNCAQWAKVRY